MNWDWNIQPIVTCPWCGKRCAVIPAQGELSRPGQMMIENHEGKNDWGPGVFSHCIPGSGAVINKSLAELIAPKPPAAKADQEAA